MISTIATIMSYLIYLAQIVGLYLSFMVVRRIGKANLNVVFLSFLSCIFFISTANVLSSVQESVFKSMDGVTFHVMWHMIAYAGFISIIWGGFRLKRILESQTAAKYGKVDWIFYGVLAFVVTVITVLLITNSESATHHLKGSIVDRWGLHHMGAFLLGGIAGWYLFYIKGKWGALGRSIVFVAGFLVLLGLQHGWEIANETHHFLPISDDAIELVEKFIILPAVLFFIVGQLQFLKIIRK